MLSKIYIKLNREITNNTFHIHLSGDGFCIAKTYINIINFTFKVLNEKNDSPKSLYTLGRFFSLDIFEISNIFLKVCLK